MQNISFYKSVKVISLFRIKAFENRMQNQLQQQIQSFIKPFINFSCLSGVQFPLLPTTYTLWRKVCYKRLQQKYNLQKNSPNQRQIKRAFIQVSQRRLLPAFLQKVKSEIDGKSIGWKKVIIQSDELKKINSTEDQQILFKYCEALYQLQLYIEMFYDLVSIPYSETYDQDKKYIRNQNFNHNFHFKKNQTIVDKACLKIGKKIISQSLVKMSQSVISRPVLIGMSGLFGAFNPLALVAGYSINYAIQSHDKYKKQQSLVSELNYLEKNIRKKINELKQIYDVSLASIQIMIYLEANETQLLEREKKKFEKNLKKVLIEDWLEIKIITQQDEWQLVELKNKDQTDNFEDIQIVTNDYQKYQKEKLS